MSQLVEQPAASDICTICQSPISESDARIRCGDCKAEYHKECWDYNGGCASYGCPRSPDVEKITDLEVPVSFWGEERKPCPVCGASIMAVATRCVNCGETFASNVESSLEFRLRQDREQRTPGNKKAIMTLFIFCLIPFSAPLAFFIGMFWYGSKKEELKLTVPQFHLGLCILGLIVSGTQTALMLIFGLLQAVMA